MLKTVLSPSDQSASSGHRLTSPTLRGTKTIHGRTGELGFSGRCSWAARQLESRDLGERGAIIKKKTKQKKLSPEQQRAGEAEARPRRPASPLRRPTSPDLCHPGAASHPANFLHSQARQEAAENTWVPLHPAPLLSSEAEARAQGASLNHGLNSLTSCLSFTTLQCPPALVSPRVSLSVCRSI